MVQNNSTDNYATARFIVSATAGQGNYTTISAALTAASSGNTIFVLPGTYTEDLTLKSGVDICAYDCDIVVPNVSIVGKCTFTGAGTVSLSGVSLNTNSDFCLVVSGSSASVVQLTNCFVRCTNSTGISYTSSGGGGIYLWYCNGNIATTGIALFSCSGSGTLQIVSGIFGNSGSSTTASTTSATFVNIKYAEISNPITTSSTGTVALQWATLNSSLTNTTALTVGGGQSTAKYSYFLSGTSTAVVVNNQMEMESCVISSSNASAISGSNTLVYSDLTFESSSSTISSSTNTQLSNGLPFSVTNGGTGLASTTANQLLYSSATNVISGLSSANGGVLSTSSSGVPSIDTTNFSVLSTGVQVKGNNTNTTPPPGFIGEQIRSTVAASGNSISTNTATNLTSISLTAGIWDVSLVMCFTGTSVGTAIRASISTTSATEGTSGDNRVNFPFIDQTTQSLTLTIPSYRIELASTTTVYAVGFIIYSVGTGTFFGRISATRVG